MELTNIKGPFLVAKDSLEMPIVGFNVIEEITRQSVGGVSGSGDESVVDVLTASLTGVERGKVEVLSNFIKKETATVLSTVKSRKQDTVIPQGQSVLVSCRAAVGPVGSIPVSFELDPGICSDVSFVKLVIEPNSLLLEDPRSETSS